MFVPSINDIKLEREKWMTWKNIAPLRSLLDALPKKDVSYSFDERVTITSELSKEEQEQFHEAAWAMRPWRKGPFQLFDTFIDSEWRSNVKFDLIKDAADLNDKVVADIGCNNGYYMFKMMNYQPKEIVGFDPSPLCKTQFDLFNNYIKAPITYELLGVEHFADYDKKFDVAFCLGVLYHRSDPVAMLKSIKKGLNKDGVLVLDTFMIDGDADIVLTPKDRYAKIPNIYFVPTVSALINWCHRAGFEDMEVITITTTTAEEQRKTEWIPGESLETFLDPDDETLTVEGYPAPKRVYMKMKVASK
jgi:tRNA (mo5U34)-methyltransferase